MKKITIQNQKVDIITFDEALNTCISLINEGKNCHVVTLNPEMVIIASNNKEFSNVINNSELSLPDGIGIKIALRFKDYFVKTIRGVDFSRALLNEASKSNLKVALLGAKQDVLDAAISNLKNEFKNLNIVYSNNGYFNDSDKIKQDIISASPNILLVALGAPKQEFFISDILKSLNSCVAVGVGGSFDVYSGFTKEAPEVFRKFGIEWLYRTFSDPKRFKRVFPTLPLFLIRSIIEGIREKFFIYGKR